MLWRLRKSQGIFPFLILLFAIPVSVHAAQTGEVSAARPAEYMIYQYPDISLVVRIDVPEAEFSSMVCGPEEALISVGAGNRFGHPSRAVLARLRAGSTRIWRTDRQGAVQVRFDASGWSLTAMLEAPAAGPGRRAEPAVAVGRSRVGWR